MSRTGPVGRGRAGWHQRQLGVVPAERHVTPHGGVLPRPVTGRDGRLVRELKPDGSLLSGLSPVCWLDARGKVSPVALGNWQGTQSLSRVDR